MSVRRSADSWLHPHKGIILPAHFIPFAEATGYIKILTRWVLAEVVRQCAEWLSNGLQLQISANISARDLMNRDLPEQIAALLAEHCVPAGLICLEITESGSWKTRRTHTRFSTGSRPWACGWQSMTTGWGTHPCPTS